jgi:hypothetical protein
MYWCFGPLSTQGNWEYLGIESGLGTPVDQIPFTGSGSFYKFREGPDFAKERFNTWWHPRRHPLQRIGERFTYPPVDFLEISYAGPSNLEELQGWWYMDDVQSEEVYTNSFGYKQPYSNWNGHEQNVPRSGWAANYHEKTCAWQGYGYKFNVAITNPHILITFEPSFTFQPIGDLEARDWYYNTYMPQRTVGNQPFTREDPPANAIAYAYAPLVLTFDWTSRDILAGFTCKSTETCDFVADHKIGSTTHYGRMDTGKRPGVTRRLINAYPGTPGTRGSIMWGTNYFGSFPTQYPHTKEMDAVQDIGGYRTIYIDSSFWSLWKTYLKNQEAKDALWGSYDTSKQAGSGKFIPAGTTGGEILEFVYDGLPSEYDRVWLSQNNWKLGMPMVPELLKGTPEEGELGHYSQNFLGKPFVVPLRANAYDKNLPNEWWMVAFGRNYWARPHGQNQSYKVSREDGREGNPHMFGTWRGKLHDELAGTLPERITHQSPSYFWEGRPLPIGLSKSMQAWTGWNKAWFGGHSLQGISPNGFGQAHWMKFPWDTPTNPFHQFLSPWVTTEFASVAKNHLNMANNALKCLAYMPSRAGGAGGSDPTGDISYLMNLKWQEDDAKDLYEKIFNILGKGKQHTQSNPGGGMNPYHKTLVGVTYSETAHERWTDYDYYGTPKYEQGTGPGLHLFGAHDRVSIASPFTLFDDFTLAPSNQLPGGNKVFSPNTVNLLDNVKIHMVNEANRNTFGFAPPAAANGIASIPYGLNFALTAENAYSEIMPGAPTGNEAPISRYWPGVRQVYPNRNKLFGFMGPGAANTPVPPIGPFPSAYDPNWE